MAASTSSQMNFSTSKNHSDRERYENKAFRQIQHETISLFVFSDGFAFIQLTSIAKSHDKKAAKSVKIYALKIPRTKRSKMFYPYQIYALELKINCIHENGARYDIETEHKPSRYNNICFVSIKGTHTSRSYTSSIEK